MGNASNKRTPKGGAPDLIELLDSFNRKERFFLVADALGTSKRFRLGNDFRARLKEAVGMEIPPDAWAAMDYHLDWLYAALHLFSCVNPKATRRNDDDIKGNQEDIDLIVAFRAGAKTKLIMIEAKAYTGWLNAQLGSKIPRLRKIFLEQRSVDPLFVLASPDKPSQKLVTSGWPNWALRDGRPIRIELPVEKHRRIVTRCDVDGNPKDGREHWMVQEATFEH